MIGPLVAGEGDHKVDVLYFASGANEMNEVMDRRVVFVDGKVTCLSCHDPYRSEGMRLVKSNSGSRLCMTCHNK
jgi:predicted CXXCH cytochrome family protein